MFGIEDLGLFREVLMGVAAVALVTGSILAVALDRVLR